MPWKASDDIVMTRCANCTQLIEVNAAQCGHCQTEYGPAFWDEFEEFFSGNEIIVPENQTMICCGRDTQYCVCKYPVPESIFEALESRTDAPIIYAADGSCHDCLHQYTPECPMLEREINQARQFLEEDSSEYWVNGEIEFCRFFDAAPDEDEGEEDESSEEDGDDEAYASVPAHLQKYC